MRNITQTPSKKWRVRFYRNKKRYGNTFINLEKAKAYRDALEKNLPKITYATAKLKETKQRHCKPENKNLPIGANYNLWENKLVSGGSHKELRIKCVYRTFSKCNERIVRNKTLYIGIIDQFSESTRQHAIKTAHAFVEDYRYCVKNQLPFYPKKYNGWKEKQLHLIPLNKRVLIEVGQPKKVHKS